MTKKYVRSKACLGVIILVLFTFQAFPHWWANYAENGFTPAGDSISTMQLDIADGAGYFLGAYTETLSFMKKIELSGKTGIDIDELKGLLGQALKNMESAGAVYSRLTEQAKAASYNPSVIERLTRFDYETFLISNSMNREIFLQVKEKLAKGDIQGCLEKLQQDILTISGLMGNVLKKLDEGIAIPLHETWALNQEFARSLLYGQYVSQVFGNL